MACLAAAPPRALACSSSRGVVPGVPAPAWPSSRTARRVGCQASAANRAAVGAAAAAPEAPAAVPAQSTSVPATQTPAIAAFPAVAISRMTDANRAFVESHRIRGNEVGPDQCTNIISVANLFQEAAGNHAVAMWGRSTEGFASDPCMKGLIFVATRLQIQVERYPRWGDVVQVRTWFQEDGKLMAQRDWQMTDMASGEVLARGTSSWVMINMQTRRLSKFPDVMRQKLEAFQLSPPHHAIPRAQTRAKLPDLELPAEIVGPVQVARRSDMDMNGHVNNVTYAAWALETVPRPIYDACHLYQLEIDFKAEGHGGDLVECLAQRCDTQEAVAANGAGPNSLSFLHVLRRCQGEHCTELVRARTTWRAGEAAV